jgi:hypothetical protein
MRMVRGARQPCCTQPCCTQSVQSSPRLGVGLGCGERSRPLGYTSPGLGVGLGCGERSRPLGYASPPQAGGD